MAAGHSPLAQFEIKRFVPIEIGNLDISFTNSSTFMVLTVIATSAFLIFGMRRNALVPGLMNTPMVADAMKDIYGDGGIEAMVAARDALSPTGKMGEGWDVANAAVFLASDEARYINGMLLHVDGGLQHLFTAGQG